MPLTVIPRVLYWRWRLRHRERWSSAELAAYQTRALAELRAFAAEKSKFYRRFHAGLDASPLDELPVLSKGALMEHYDEISTDEMVRLDAIEKYLARPDEECRFAGRFWISGTSGSSGRRAIIATDPREWATVIASYARAQEWAGVRPTLRHRTRMAVVSSTTAWHQSARVGATVQSPLVETLRLDAGDPQQSITGALNRFQPEILVAYASMIRALAEAQLSGSLRIEPRAVCSSSEVLTAKTRALAKAAWHAPPFNVYAATETGGIAAECERHSLHLFEDLVIPEVVDDLGKPVPAGVTGDRLLATVLFSRTLPLIRYEMSDRVTLSSETCPCGRPFRVIAAIEGRTDDVIELPGLSGGFVKVHPVVFHRVLDLIRSAGWQVRQEEHGLRVLIAAPEQPFDADGAAASVRTALEACRALSSVTVEIVERIKPGASGKRPLVVALRASKS